MLFSVFYSYNVDDDNVEYNMKFVEYISGSHKIYAWIMNVLYPPPPPPQEYRRTIA